MTDVTDAADLTAADAEALATVVEAMGGTQRPSQQQMVQQVSGAIADGEVLLVQAGTGTGKSVGYLVPAVQAVRRSGQRVVISTATLALQRQLLSRDLPAVLAGLPDGAPVSFCVLKGRGNYLCRARLAGADHGPEEELDLGVGGRLEAQAANLREWSEETDTGDRDDYDGDVDDRVWRSLSATGRECVGATRCEFGEECFAEQARSAATSADIIITNHALLALDALDDNPVVPDHDVLMVDEAHEFSARATSAATDELSVRMAERAIALARPLLSDETMERMTDAVEGLGKVLGGFTEQERPMPQPCVPPLAALRDAFHLAMTAVTADDSSDPAVRHRAASALEEIHDMAGRLITSADSDVTWFTPYPAPSLHAAPLSVAAALGEYLAQPHATVLTSATLTLGGDFGTLAGDLGLAQARWSGEDVGSPFDYPKQGILYAASDLPRPGRDGPDTAVVARIRDLITAAGGRTMVLLSSWRAVDTVAANLIEKRILPDVEVHVQRRGEPVARLVDRFAADETSILVGTMSLFQGVDVPGSSCSLVIIDRIPFPRPDDPVLAARSDRVEQAGGSGFMAVSVPRAALLLAQGAGRLIRSQEDRGVVAVLDPRLVTARYGTFLRRSLPPMWFTTDQAVAVSALQRLAVAATDQ